MTDKKVVLSVRELKGLLFWARVGICGSRSGSFRETVDLIPRLCRDIGFQLGKVKFLPDLGVEELEKAREGKS